MDVFCLKREPMEWLFSWYRYRPRKALVKRSGPTSNRYTGDQTFSDFVKDLLENGKATSARQSGFFLLDNGRLGVNRVFSMNRMDLVSEYLSEKIGEKIELPHLNVSPEMEFTLDPAIEKMAIKHLEDDFRIYKKMEESGIYTRKIHKEVCAHLIKDSGKKRKEK
jgi:hypothetical protein